MAELELKFKREGKEAERLEKLWVDPHNKVSREVKERDLERVKKDAQDMFNLCFIGRGRYQSGFAVAHSQINKKDPLRFFVDINANVIINPVILNHTKTTVDSEEACLSFPEKGKIIVQRYNRLEVEFTYLDDKGKMYDESGKEYRQRITIGGKEARIWQHEVDHLNAKYIYNL